MIKRYQKQLRYTAYPEGITSTKTTWNSNYTLHLIDLQKSNIIPTRHSTNKKWKAPNVTTQRCTKQTKSVTNMSDGVVKSLKRNITLLKQKWYYNEINHVHKLFNFTQTSFPWYCWWRLPPNGTLFYNLHWQNHYSKHQHLNIYLETSESITYHIQQKDNLHPVPSKTCSQRDARQKMQLHS